MRPGEVVLCVDHGTTGTTAVLVDRDGGWVSLGLDADRDVFLVEAVAAKTSGDDGVVEGARR